MIRRSRWKTHLGAGAARSICVSALLALQGRDGRFDATLAHVRADPQARHGVDDLAAHVCMSPRRFARTFRATTGVTPAKAVERQRVESDRAALDGGAVSVQRVAADCGFGDPAHMRRTFVRLLGVPPSAQRRIGATSTAGWVCRLSVARRASAARRRAGR